MPTTNYSREEIARRGEAIFEQRIRHEVEGRHEGEYVVLDIATGQYEVDPEDLVATQRLLARCSNAILYGLRIGHRAAYRLGGVWKASNP